MDGGVIANTKPNFFSNTSRITYSSRAANNPYLLGKTMAHETAHAYVNRITRYVGGYNTIKTGFKDGRLNDIEHLAIKKLENVYYKINLNGMNMNNLNIIPSEKINSIINTLSPAMKFQVNVWTERLYDVFNRKVTYQGIAW